MKKRLLSMLLIFILVFTAVAPISAADSANGFAGGSGTENDPYLIATKAQLDQVRNDLTAHYKLTNDIVFTEDDFSATGDYYNNGTGWEPIGKDETASFTGVFDGNNHAIENIFISVREAKDTLCVGLFARNSGTIKNLSLVNGSVYGRNTTLYTDEYLNAHIGGIAGENLGTIENCNNTAEVIGAADKNQKSDYTNTLLTVGGIAGLNSGEVRYCHNDGKISVAEAYHQFNVGGIVGSGSGISDCSNSGEVSTTNNTNGSAYLGGIAGSSGNLRRCYNTGKVTASSPNLHGGSVGGIVGYSSRPWYNEQIEISNCYNSGTITISSTASFHVGGIGGLVFMQDIRNCFNIGNIIATDAESINAGGIVGYCDYRLNIETCYNIGDISKNGNYGSMVGTFFSKEIKDCYYLDNVSTAVGTYEDAIIQCSQATKEQLREQATFTGFDFETVWTMGGNPDYLYPELQLVALQYEKMPVSVVIQTLPHKLTYTEGEEFNPAGLVLSATFNNGTTEAVTDYTVTGYTATPGIKTITVTYEGKSVTFEVEVLAEFSFSDVEKNAWYYESVQAAHDLGLMLGMSETTFEPDTTMSRAMMVTLLYRLAGSPSVNELHPFTDTDANAWYADALNWAAANQLVNGTTPTTFEPDDSLTRAQMATLLYRYAQFSGQDVSARADLSTFPDSADVPVWALEAMQWAVAEEHIRGIYNKLVPQENTTRAQVATLLTRYIQH